MIKKVVFTCNRIGTGGAERVITNIANRMARNGILVYILCYDVLPGFYYPLKDGVTIVELDKELSVHKSFVERKIYGFRNLGRLYKTLKNIKPDVVISFYTRQNCYSILCSNMLHIPIIAAERDHFFTIDSKVNHILRKIFYQKADGFIHQTKWAKKYLENNYKTPSDAIVLHNPIWIEKFPNRNFISKEVIAVGRLDEQKNYKGMIAAFELVIKKIPNAVLKIYGNGSQREELSNIINAKALSKNIFLMGQTNDVLNCYKKADIFIMFSHGEGYPNALMEALACGVPAIASDCPIGGPAELIEDGVNGYLTKNEDINEFAKKIITLLLDDEVKMNFSKNAINIRKTNSMDSIYRELIFYIERVCRKNNRK